MTNRRKSFATLKELQPTDRPTKGRPVPDGPNRPERRSKGTKHPHRKSVRQRFRTLTGKDTGSPTLVYLIFHPTKVSTSKKREANRSKRHRQNHNRKVNR